MKKLKYMLEWICIIKVVVNEHEKGTLRLVTTAFYAPLNGDNGRTRGDFWEKLYNIVNECEPAVKLFQ